MILLIMIILSQIFNNTTLFNAFYDYKLLFLSNHVGLMDYKECTSHKKQAKSNTNWKAPVERGTNDLLPYATSTDRDTPLPRGVSVSHPPERRKARSPQSYKHGTEMEEPDKHREHYYHPYAKNTYWDAPNARGSRASHPYSSYREVRKAERTMEEHRHYVAAEFIGQKVWSNP